MDWIAKIVNGKADEFVHAKLVKYGVGEHPGPRGKLTFTSSKIGFKADIDLEKVFIRAYLQGATSPTHKVSGTVVCYTDRTADLSRIAMPLDWSKSKGEGATVFKSKLAETVPLGHLRELVDKDDPTTFFLLSLEPADGEKTWKVTTKPSFPKGTAAPKQSDGEASESGEETAEKDPVFTKGTLGRTSEVEKMILDEVIPDVRTYLSPKTKTVTINQTIVIESIEIPDDPKLSFPEKRRLAKKTGRLIRRIDIDGKEIVNEFRFKV